MGQENTEKTTFQVAYDDEALYIGIMCYDSEPDKIVSRLARRDQFMSFEVEPMSATNPNGRDLFSSAGIDLRYGVSSNFSLNATINPDFGQVEADPAVLNLSVFETFFQERRPFFVEGASIFRTPIQLFYSRRIGRRPSHFPIPSGSSSTIDRPQSTTILGAAKLTGKTSDKTTIGILNALTSAEYATIEDRDGINHREHRLEPLSNYFVGRVRSFELKRKGKVGHFRR